MYNIVDGTLFIVFTKNLKTNSFYHLLWRWKLLLIIMCHNMLSINCPRNYLFCHENENTIPLCFCWSMKYEGFLCNFIMALAFTIQNLCCSFSTNFDLAKLVNMFCFFDQNLWVKELAISCFELLEYVKAWGFFKSQKVPLKHEISFGYSKKTSIIKVSISTHQSLQWQVWFLLQLCLNCNFSYSTLTMLLLIDCHHTQD